MATLSTPPLQTATLLDPPAAIRLWHLTSLDAPTVAVVWTLAFARAAHAALPAWLVLVVGLSAWAFYIADRLFDAHRARTPLRQRHHFHWRHRRIFLPIGALAAATALILVLRNMPPRAEVRDSLLAFAALAYFTGVHREWIPRLRRQWQPRPGLNLGPDQRLRFTLNPARRLAPRLVPKELLVAIVFTAACATPALSRAASPAALLPVLLAFVALAWLNCEAIEVWEAEPAPPPVGSRPFVSRISRNALALTVLALLAALAAATLHQPRMALLLTAAAVSAALLGLLNHHRPRFSAMALRTGADLGLLTPLVLLALHP